MMSHIPRGESLPAIKYMSPAHSKKGSLSGMTGFITANPSAAQTPSKMNEFFEVHDLLGATGYSSSEHRRTRTQFNFNTTGMSKWSA